MYTLPGLWHGSSPFSGFGDGTALLGSEGGRDVREELSERVRAMGEACDQLQGGGMLICVPSAHMLVHVRLFILCLCALVLRINQQ